MQKVTFVYPTSTFGGSGALLSFKDLELPKSVVTSRGSFPPCGNGPYFKAVKEPAEVWVNTSQYKLKWVLGQRGSTFAGVQTAIDKQFVLYTGTSREVYIGLLEIIPDTTPTGFVVRTRQYRTTGSFPTTLSAWYNSIDAICNRVVNTVKPYNDFKGNNRGSVKDVRFALAPIQFLYSELSVFSTIDSLGIYPAGYAGAFSAAYVNAVEDFNLAQVNTLENVISLVEDIVAIVRFVKAPISSMKHYFEQFLTKYEIRDFDKKRVPGNAKDLWLAYRYQYVTTSLDIKEYKELVSRLKALKALTGRKIRGRGSFSNAIGSFGCVLSVSVEDVLPDGVADWLDTIGLTPTATNIWDIVPYSFIVDWFLHVDKIIDYFDQIGNAIDLPVSSCWFTFMNSYDSQHIFFRVPGRRLEILPQYVTREASTKTIKMRVADSISLLIGRY